MKAKLKTLIQRCRSFGINQTAGLLNLVAKIRYQDPDHPIGWRDHLRWWLEGFLGMVFCWVYAGSDEEIEAVFNSELPVKYMNSRQRAILINPRADYRAHCCHCDWEGTWDQCTDADHCPDCGEGIYLDAFTYHQSQN